MDSRLTERLAGSGFRFTPQRQHVYNVLVRHPDHPTTDEVFMRAKQVMPDISMATVYNCLDALVKCGLVRQVNLDRSATRYCPNMTEHVHFFCEQCGGIFDIEAAESAQQGGVRVPTGFEVHHTELAIRGLCADCASQGPRRPQPSNRFP